MEFYNYSGEHFKTIDFSAYVNDRQVPFMITMFAVQVAMIRKDFVHFTY